MLCARPSGANPGAAPPGVVEPDATITVADDAIGNDVGINPSTSARPPLRPAASFSALRSLGSSATR